MRVLVTGGAGYIGSVVVELLVEAGHRVVVLDNLATGHRRAVHPDAAFAEGDTRDRARVEAVLAEHAVEAVVHMAAISQVGTSVIDPRAYFDNNVRGALTLLDAMLARSVGRVVFSSTASVYGQPERLPVDEGAALRPTSPYGDTKLFIETVLNRYDAAYGLRYAALRYFNAAGASTRFGEDHRPETHLIPRLLAVAAGADDPVTVFGDDYETRDGTCVRDYIHVVDLARAHLLALAALDQGSLTYNLGCGGGYTVSEVIAAARRVTGHPVPVTVGPRRAGDPAVLVASSERIQRELGWAPQRADLDRIIGSAWAWKQRFPQGYSA
jgi:UDP-glucose 4-epimerase